MALSFGLLVIRPAIELLASWWCSEATVTAEISTMRLDMGDMQEALKAHDAWMEAGDMTLSGI